MITSGLQKKQCVSLCLGVVALVICLYNIRKNKIAFVKIEILHILT